MEKLNFNQFKLELKDITEKIFHEVIKKYGKDNICGFALYSDESAGSISASVNTCTHLKKKQLKYPDDQVMVKWTPAEWAYENVEYDYIKNLSKKLSDISSHFGEDGLFEEFKSKVFDSILDVLIDLKNEKLFDSMNEYFVLLFATSDYSHPEEAIRWAKMLNSTSLSKELENYLNG
jgi:hypothetical protein